jgi:hypothetical protein
VDKESHKIKGQEFQVPLPEGLALQAEALAKAWGGFLIQINTEGRTLNKQ